MFMFVCIYVCIYKHACVYIYPHTPTHPHPHTYIRTHIHTHKYTCVCCVFVCTGEDDGEIPVHLSPTHTPTHPATHTETHIHIDTHTHYTHTHTCVCCVSVNTGEDDGEVPVLLWAPSPYTDSPLYQGFGFSHEELDDLRSPNVLRELAATNAVRESWFSGCSAHRQKFSKKKVSYIYSINGTVCRLSRMGAVCSTATSGPILPPARRWLFSFFH